MTMHTGTCPGPAGEPIPHVMFSGALGDGMVAVSLARGRAVISTSAFPGDPRELPIMLSPEDRQQLGNLLLAADEDAQP